MATLGLVMSRAKSDAVIDRAVARQVTDGHTFWAMERRPDGAFLGWCGIVRARDDLPIAGELEIGWRLAAEHWGQGYASEGARASLAWAWAETVAPQAVAITAALNARSRRVMERVGIAQLGDGDFLHPAVALDSPLQPHVTYAIERPA